MGSVKHPAVNNDSPAVLFFYILFVLSGKLSGAF